MFITKYVNNQISSSRFKSLINLNGSLLTFTLTLFVILIKILLILTLISIFVSNHLPTQKWIFRNSQTWIYPFMRWLRLLTLPLLKKYPHLTNYHEQECIISNPYYRTPNLECWPCEDIPAIVELTNLSEHAKIFIFQTRPFIVKDVIKTSVTLELLTQVYLENKKEINIGTTQFKSSQDQYLTLDQFFDNTSHHFQKNVNIIWKMSRVSATRVIRKIFPRPYFIPKESEISLKKYIFLDGSQSLPYHLPLTEFTNVWLIQAQGYRLIILDPSDICKNNCSSVSILLTPNDVLYYNWQLYRPRSLSVNLSTDLSITFVGSFY